jgi:hypothetical protein
MANPSNSYSNPIDRFQSWHELFSHGQESTNKTIPCEEVNNNAIQMFSKINSKRDKRIKQFEQIPLSKKVKAIQTQTLSTTQPSSQTESFLSCAVPNCEECEKIKFEKMIDDVHRSFIHDVGLQKANERFANRETVDPVNYFIKTLFSSNAQSYETLTNPEILKKTLPQLMRLRLEDLKRFMNTLVTEEYKIFMYLCKYRFRESQLLLVKYTLLIKPEKKSYDGIFSYFKHLATKDLIQILFTHDAKDRRIIDNPEIAGNLLYHLAECVKKGISDEEKKEVSSIKDNDGKTFLDYPELAKILSPISTKQNLINFKEALSNFPF